MQSVVTELTTQKTYKYMHGTETQRVMYTIKNYHYIPKSITIIFHKFCGHRNALDRTQECYIYIASLHIIISECFL